MASPRMVYTAVIDDDGVYRLGIVKEGEQGYYKVREDSDAGGTFDSFDDAQEVATAYNDRLGVSKEDAMTLVFESMRTTRA